MKLLVVTSGRHVHHLQLFVYEPPFVQVLNRVRREVLQARQVDGFEGVIDGSMNAAHFNDKRAGKIGVKVVVFGASERKFGDDLE